MSHPQFDAANRRHAAHRTTSVFTIPFAACAYSLILSPLLLYFNSNVLATRGLMESRVENKFFWPFLCAIAIVGALRNLPSRRIICPPHVVWLFLYLALAGASVLWAFSAEFTFVRFVQQVMIVTSVIIPAIFASKRSDYLQGAFVCLAIAVMLNCIFVLTDPPQVVDKAFHGYAGYFTSKNYLGECAGIGLIISLYAVLQPGLRRWGGVIIFCLSIALVVVSNSKTALGLALLAPLVSVPMLVARRLWRVSPAVSILCAIAAYVVFSMFSGFTMNRLSYMLYGDSSITGRQVIWDYIGSEIGHRPLFGWGYQSFWLVGPTGPSVVNAPGWVKTMPNSHNGYYDTMLELGYSGFILLALFLIATVHGIGRIMDDSASRGWVALSLALFVLMYNGLETAWFRGFEFLWIVFLLVAAEVAQQAQMGSARSSKRPALGWQAPRSQSPTAPRPVLKSL